MEWFIKAFVRASLAWFAAGIILGVAMAAHPAWVVYRPAHAHMNVAGFITMMIFGVGYQLLPRMFGHALHSRALAIAHLWIANVGLMLMIVGFALGPRIGVQSAPITATGGTLYALGALAWVYNLWRTFDAADARQQARLEADRGKKSLTTLE
jgi:cbb3-type cytochrome oxidase subunit 1